MNITTILFDFGGVLVDLDRERCLRAYRALSIDADALLGDYGQQGIFSRFERGKIRVGELCDMLRTMTGDYRPTDAELIRAFELFLVGIPRERLDCLLRIKRHYRLDLLSNTNPIHWRMATDELFRYRGLGVDDFFDHTFLSFQIGIEKPAPGIFRAVSAAGIAPSNTLFLDDSETNCEAARAEGFQARLAPQGGGWMDYFDSDGRLCI